MFPPTIYSNFLEKSQEISHDLILFLFCFFVWKRSNWWLEGAVDQGAVLLYGTALVSILSLALYPMNDARDFASQAYVLK